MNTNPAAAAAEGDRASTATWVVRLLAVASALLLLSTATFTSVAQAQSVARPLSCTFIRYGDSAEVTFAASDADNATRYVLQRKLNDEGWKWNGKIEKTSPSRTFVKDDLSTGDVVRYRVFARNGDIKSDRRWCSNEWQPQARWAFNSNLEDDIGNRDVVAGVPNTDPAKGHDGDVNLKNGRIEFNGNEGSIVIADVSDGEGRFNPDGSQLRWVTRFKIPATSVDLIIAQHEQALQDIADDLPKADRHPIPSWNVVQRGFANNAGGQWKTQIVVKKVAGNFQAFAECIVRDMAGSGRIVKQPSTVPVTGGDVHTVVCDFDDANDELGITFDGQAEPSPETPSVDDGDPAFGDVTPSGSATCESGASDNLGDSITIGNKPACGNIDPEDSFIGTIYKVEILKR